MSSDLDFDLSGLEVQKDRRRPKWLLALGLTLPALLIGALIGIPFVVNSLTTAQTAIQGIAANSNIQTSLDKPSPQIEELVRSVAGFPKDQDAKFTYQTKRLGWRTVQILAEYKTLESQKPIVFPVYLKFNFQRGWKVDTARLANEAVRVADVNGIYTKAEKFTKPNPSLAKLTNYIARGKKAQQLLNIAENANPFLKLAIAQDQLKASLALVESHQQVVSLIAQGRQFQSQGELEQALTVLRKAAESANKLGNKQREEQALTLVSQIETSQAEQANIEQYTTASNLIAQGREYYGQARFADAIGNLQDALEIAQGLGDPMLQAEANSLLGFVYRDYTDAPNNMQRAVRHAQQATDLQPSNGDYWCSLGDLYRQERIFEQSARAFRTGISRSNDNETKSECYVWFGVLHSAQYDYYAARQAWQTALDLNPDNANALKFLN